MMNAGSGKPMSPITSGEPLISVVMPFLNAETYMEEAVASVLAQSYSNWELLFVDDGSTDSSTAIAHRYVTQDPARARYLEHDGHSNRGISASRNAGVTRALGTYVAFLDADDVWMPHRLRSQIEIMEAQPQAAMIFGLSRYWYSWTGKTEDLQRDFIPDPGVKTETLYAPPELLLKLYPLGQATAPSMSNLLVRRELVKDSIWFEEEFRGLYEDQAFLAKVYLQGHIYVSGECWDKYRIHPESCLSVGTETGQYDAVRSRFLKWLERYLNDQGNHDPAVRAALQKAFETRSAPQEVTHFDGWLFRVAPPNTARLTSLPGKPGAIRVAIENNREVTPVTTYNSTNRVFGCWPTIPTGSPSRRAPPGRGWRVWVSQWPTNPGMDLASTETSRLGPTGRLLTKSSPQLRTTRTPAFTSIWQATPSR